MNALKMLMQAAIAIVGGIAALTCVVLLLALILAYLAIAIVAAICAAPFGIIYAVIHNHQLSQNRQKGLSL